MALYSLSAGYTAVSTDASMVASLGVTAVVLQAHISNTVAVLVGGSATQALALSAGVTITVPVSNLNQVYAKTSAGSALLGWLALGGGREA